MPGQAKPRVLIVGAGSMGVVTGYHLSLAGAQITFLIRPHRAEALSRPQILYSYDDNELKELGGYEYITEPSKIADATYDFILVTLDGSALQSDTGKALVSTIAEAIRDTHTKILVGSVFPNSCQWFLSQSGLPSSQATSGYLGTQVYDVARASAVVPVHPPADAEVVAKADHAYSDKLGWGFLLDGDGNNAAEAFATLYDACGVSKAVIKSSEECALLGYPMFAVLAACDLLGWPSYNEIDSDGELWRLATAAAKEIQSLGIAGKIGEQAASATTEEALLSTFAQLEEQLQPMAWQAFNKYHHGGKVNVQDKKLLRDCIELGRAEGKGISALTELLRRMEEKGKSIQMTQVITNLVTTCASSTLRLVVAPCDNSPSVPIIFTLATTNLA